MATSFTIAARNNGFTKVDARESTLAAVTAYRESMTAFAAMRTMDIWYAHLDESQLMESLHGAQAEIGGQRRRAARTRSWQTRP
jgi:hypothetical protein